MNITEFLTKSYNARELFPGYTLVNIRPRIVCKDGFNISVQASENHYCSPRINTSDGSTYTEVECGYPSEMARIPYDQLTENDFQSYAEDPHSLTKSVYGYVPVHVVDNLLNSHGGIDVERTFA